MLRAYYLSAQELAGPRAKEAKLRVEEALGKCVLPSLQLIPANPAVGQVVWEVLSLLPYEVCTASVLFLLCAYGSFNMAFKLWDNLM